MTIDVVGDLRCQSTQDKLKLYNLTNFWLKHKFSLNTV